MKGFFNRISLEYVMEFPSVAKLSRGDAEKVK